MKIIFTNSDWQHIGVAAKNLAESIGADGIIAITRTGKTANYISNSNKKWNSFFTFTENKKTLNQLSLVGSTIPFYLTGLFDQHYLKISKILKNFYKEIILNLLWFLVYFLKNILKKYKSSIYKLCIQ